MKRCSAASRRPSRGLPDEVFIAILRTAEALIRDMDKVLQPTDLTLTQYNVLRILRGAEPGGLACGEIAERMLTRDPDITRLLDRLEARRLVMRARERTDRRVVKTRITAGGLRILEPLDEPVAEAHRRQMQQLDEGQMRTLVGLLKRAWGEVGE